MYWVIQNNICSEEGHEKLITALERLGLPHSLHKVVPFSGTIEPDVHPPDGPVIVMGSYTLANIAKLKGWNPGSFINENLNFIIQREHWGEAMLNYDAKIYKFKDVPEFIEPVFMRPIHDSKAFTGMVIDYPTFEEWRNNIAALLPEDQPTMNGDTEVMICTKKEIYTETRCWIVDGRVVTASGYKRGTIKIYSDVVEPRIIEFAESHSWSPHRAYVMDIADTPNGLKIVEVNNLNSAGFYKADMNKLVMSLETAFGNTEANKD